MTETASGWWWKVFEREKTGIRQMNNRVEPPDDVANGDFIAFSMKSVD